MHPLESVACVTSAGKAQLTTLQYSDWEPRTEYGVQMEEPTEQPALLMAVSGVHTLLETEREARSSHNVRKRKKRPTTEENTHIRTNKSFPSDHKRLWIDYQKGDFSHGKNASKTG